jgi:hypothetical protein
MKSRVVSAHTISGHWPNDHTHYPIDMRRKSRFTIV